MSLYRRDEKQIYTFWLFTAGDIVSITMLLGVAFLLAFVQNRSNDGIVVKVVSIQGEEKFEIDQAMQRTYKGPLGMTIIENDSEGVYISESPCSKQICVFQGPIKNRGEIIACVPNRIVVTIWGETDLYDAVAK